MKYRRRKKHNKNQRKILIISMVSLIFVMTVGYAAFSTNLNINAKGNIIKQTAAQKLRKICDTKDGDGLYIDVYEENRCVYRGSNPNNYIEFNDELWRIIAIEPDDTLKIIKIDSIGQMSFDEANYRDTASNSFCKTPIYGCSIFSAIPGEIHMFDFSGIVTEDSSVKNYLNDTYYPTLNEAAKNVIINHSFNIGPVIYDFERKNDTIALNISYEKKYTWSGMVGLINVSDVLRASRNEKCTSVSSAAQEPSLNDEYKQYCNDSYLFRLKSSLGWTINADISDPMNTYVVWTVIGTSESGFFSGNSAFINRDVYPVLFLNSNITLIGEGTESNPYKISSE